MCASSHYWDADARVQQVSATTSATDALASIAATKTATFYHYYYFSAPNSTAIDRRIALSPPEVFQTSGARRSFITE